MTPVLTPTKQKLVWSILIVTFVVLGTLLIWRGFGEQVQTEKFSRPEGSALAVFGPAPDFTLTERSGKKFSKDKLAGKPWIADFIFTSCAGQCPLMSAQMRTLQDSFPRDSGVRFVSFTVDPKRDTPKALAAYADGFAAEKDRWFFLTGPKDEINRTLKGFFLSGVDDPNMHSTRFVLIDADSRIRGYYDMSEQENVKQLIYDAKLLLNKKG